MRTLRRCCLLCLMFCYAGLVIYVREPERAEKDDEGDEDDKPKGDGD